MAQLRSLIVFISVVSLRADPETCSSSGCGDEVAFMQKGQVLMKEGKAQVEQHKSEKTDAEWCDKATGTITCFSWVRLADVTTSSAAERAGVSTMLEAVDSSTTSCDSSGAGTAAGSNGWSALTENTPWWQADLHETHTILGVRVTNSNQNSFQNGAWNMFVDNRKCCRAPPMAPDTNTPTNDVGSADCDNADGVTGRVIHIESTDYAATMRLCEVEVKAKPRKLHFVLNAGTEYSHADAGEACSTHCRQIKSSIQELPVWFGGCCYKAFDETGSELGCQATPATGKQHTCWCAQDDFAYRYRADNTAANSDGYEDKHRYICPTGPGGKLKTQKSNLKCMDYDEITKNVYMGTCMYRDEQSWFFAKANIRTHKSNMCLTYDEDSRNVYMAWCNATLDNFKPQFWDWGGCSPNAATSCGSSMEVKLAVELNSVYAVRKLRSVNDPGLCLNYNTLLKNVYMETCYAVERDEEDWYMETWKAVGDGACADSAGTLFTAGLYARCDGGGLETARQPKKACRSLAECQSACKGYCPGVVWSPYTTHKACFVYQRTAEWAGTTYASSTKVGNKTSTSGDFVHADATPWTCYVKKRMSR